MLLHCAYGNNITLELESLSQPVGYFRINICGTSSCSVKTLHQQVQYEEKNMSSTKESLPPALLFALYCHEILIKLLWLQQASDLLCSACMGSKPLPLGSPLLHSVDFHGSRQQPLPRLAVTERKQTARQILTLVEGAFCLRLATWVWDFRSLPVPDASQGSGCEDEFGKDKYDIHIVIFNRFP